jgi:hypothetical protein
MSFFKKNQNKTNLKGEFTMKGKSVSTWKSLKDAREPRKSQADRRLIELKSALDEKIRPRFENAKVFLRDHWNIMFRSAAENHLRIQQLKLKPIPGEVCNLSFGSYTELKRYQQKVRMFTYSLSSTFASVIVAIIVINVFFPGSKSLGATYNLMQTSWSGGLTSNTAAHPNDKSGWNQYSSKSSAIAVANGGADLQLSTSTNSTVQTSDADFNAGTNSGTTVSGTGDSAAVQITQTLTPVNNWRMSMPGIPVNVSYGSNSVYNPTDQAVYVTQGGGLNGFYKYVVSTNTWTTLNNTPTAIGRGSSMIRVPSGDLYVIAGQSTTAFHKFTLSTNSWSTKAYLPASIGSPYSNVIYTPGEDYFYVNQGLSSGFYRYQFSTNTWTTLASQAMSLGSSMVRNGNLIYATQGWATGFVVYDITANTWTALAVAPGAIGNGSAMSYIAGEDFIYVPRGYGGTEFYRYQISTNTWTTLAAVPGAVGMNSSTAYDGESVLRNGDSIYVTQQTAGNGFYKYSIASNSWIVLTTVPSPVGEGAAFTLSANPNQVFVTSGGSNNFSLYDISTDKWLKGTTIGAYGQTIPMDGYSYIFRKGSEEYIYIIGVNAMQKFSIKDSTWTTLSLPGKMTAYSYDGTSDELYAKNAGSANIYRYVISTNTWTVVTQLPFGDYNGHFVRAGTSNDLYYLVEGGWNRFYKYSISANSWTDITGIGGFPGGKWASIIDGHDGNFYLMSGNGSYGFYKYNLASGVWTALASTPTGVSYSGIGEIMTRNGVDDEIYAAIQASTSFWKYSVSANTWTVLAAAPLQLNMGGSKLIRNGSADEIYAIAMVWNGDAFLKYSISTNTWTSLANPPGDYTGGIIIRNGGDNDFYMIRGTADFYKYTINDVSYNSPATYTSGVIDVGGAVSSWGNIGWSKSGLQDPSIRIRTSDTANGVASAIWSSSTTTNTGVSLASLGAQTGHRFIQYEATLTTPDSRYTPSLNDVTIGYTYYGTPSIAPKIIMHLDGNGNIANNAILADSSENSNNVVTAYNVNGTGLSYQAGKLGQAVNLDGVDDYINDTIAPSSTYKAFTIESWFNAASTVGTITAINSGGAAGSGIGICPASNAYCTQNSFVGNIVDKGVLKTTLYTTQAYNDGNWHHGVLSYDGSVARLYVDGVEKANATLNYNLSWPTTYAVAGSGTGAHWSRFTGKLDEIAIYNRALSANEVTARYNNGNGWIEDSVNRYNLNSSAYDTSSDADILNKIRWTETLPAGTDIKFQVRTSPNNATWTDWMGPDGTNSSYFTDAANGEAMPSVLSDGVNDRWIQYNAKLVSSGLNTPTLSDVTMTYVVNAPPEVQIVSASQGSDGRVTVNFQVRDPDTATGATPGNVHVELQDCFSNCSNNDSWSTITVSPPAPPGGSLGMPAILIGDASVNNDGITYADHQFVWDARNTNILNSALQIRVLAYDGEAANNTGYGNTTVAIDGKEPTIGAIKIDHTQNKIIIPQPSDDNNYDIYASNWFEGLLDPSNKTTLNQSSTYPNSYTFNSLTTDPATVYVGIKDAFGNFETITTTTPAKPDKVVYYDISNSGSGEYREFIAWDVLSLAQVGSGFKQYNIYRSTDGSNFSLLTSVPDRTKNYYLDTGLNSGTKYYYKLTTEDTNGNISQYSSTVDDTPDGQGGTDQTPPTISNVTISGITTTSAVIRWNTDELADSSVGYSQNTEYLPERGLATMTKDHELVLTNLTPDTTYNIRVKSRDLVGNLGQNDKDNAGLSPVASFYFTTNPGPAISSVTIPNVSNNQATISWKTTTNSSSYVVYSDTISNGDLVSPKEFGSPDLVGGNAPYGHSQTITSYNDQSLVPNTKYYFYVKSVDGAGNIAVDNNGGLFYELVTTEDNDGPVISSVDVPLAQITSNSAVVSWSTDEPATSKVSYKKHSDSNYSDTEEVLVYDRSHYVILSNLEADTAYDFKVTSKDINGNQSAADDNSKGAFTTLKSTEFAHDPISKIENINVPDSNLGDRNAIITFTTDQPALCYVKSTVVSDDYSNSITSAEDGFTQNTNYNRSHAIRLIDLIPQTKYYFKAYCHDNLFDLPDEAKRSSEINSDEHDFTTKDKMYTADGIGALLDKQPPVITNVNVANVTGESATITWTTDEKASSTVRYGISSVDESGAIDSTVNKSVDNYNTSHSVTINGLIPANKYLYVVSSSDASGNISQSSEASFDTAAPSSLSSLSVESKNLGEATVSWQTSEETTSQVEYGLSTSYGEKKESSTYAKEHSISLSNLNQGETYHYRVKGKNRAGRWYASADNTFQPKSPAKISDISINDITEHGAIVTFKTDVPTDAEVKYTDVKDNQTTGSQGTRELSTDHKIELQNLNQGTTFSIVISVKDEQGTQSQINGPDLTTGKDEKPPVIENIKTDSALTQSDKVQTIISWKTDEQATTSILYREGRNGDEKSIDVTDNLTNSHIAVITVFKPGMVYNFKVKSIDASGNEAISSDFALLTPRRKENIIQIIINNFQDIFGWARM